MRCPACSTSMVDQHVDGILIDQCPQCGGLWFDAFELHKFDEAHEGGEHLLRADALPPPSDAPPRSCPRCTDVTLLQHHSSVRRALEVDECGNCGGVFLDGGELARYRNEFATQHARNTAAEVEFSRTIDETLDTMRRETEEDTARVRRTAHALRFLCPSWYIKGKQSWGAH